MNGLHIMSLSNYQKNLLYMKLPLDKIDIPASQSMYSQKKRNNAEDKTRSEETLNPSWNATNNEEPTAAMGKRCIEEKHEMKSKYTLIRTERETMHHVLAMSVLELAGFQFALGDQAMAHRTVG